MRKNKGLVNILGVDKDLKKSVLVLSRYILIILLLLLAPVFYIVLSPLTVYSSAYLLKIFYEVSVRSSDIIINHAVTVELISACVAVAAYLLLIIANISVGMDVRRRVLSIAFSIALLFCVNVLRIVILAILYVAKFTFFDITHKIFWYFLSTLFVVIIWFLTVKVFSISEVPFYSDLKYLLGMISKK
jgi:exosortase/archaeosortase family protein